jgi:GntR family transcriptional repressor for pyruvate dehydrogenase complex
MHAEPATLRSTEVARRLEAFILERGYKPGDRLPSERELTTHFSVSRTAIREGIKLLSQSGLLESSVGRGLYVRQVDSEPIYATLNMMLQQVEGKARSIVEVRNALETLAVRLAAVHATDDDLAELDRHLEEMERCLKERSSYAVVGQAIHVALARASHNPLLGVLLEPLMRLTMDHGEGVPPALSPSHQGLVNHQEIVAAIRARDPDAAQAAMERHISYLMHMRNELNPEWESVIFGARRTSGEGGGIPAPG